MGGGNLSVYIPEKLMKRLDLVAQEANQNRSAFVRECLELILNAWVDGETWHYEDDSRMGRLAEGGRIEKLRVAKRLSNLIISAKICDNCFQSLNQFVKDLENEGRGH